MTATESAQFLIDHQFLQVSRKHGLFGRVPSGMTAQAALFEASMQQYVGLPNESWWREHQTKWCAMLGEDRCAAFYARVYATGDNARQVSHAVVREFHRLKGKIA